MTSSRPSARCRALLLEVSRYLDGDLTAARRRAVERHIVDCSCCGAMAEGLRRTIEACRAERNERPPRAVRVLAAKRIRALIGDEPARRPPVESRRANDRTRRRD